MAKAYLYDLTDTWDAAGTTFNAIKMNVTDTASAAASLLMDLQVGGASRFSVRKDGLLSTAAKAYFASATVTLGETGSGEVTVRSSGGFGWSPDATGVSTPDTILRRDTADTLAQRRGVNAQTFRVYNTYTDASNYERLNIWWTASTAFIETLSAGTGTPRSLSIGANGAGTRVTLFTAGTNRWRVDSSGHFTAEADNTYDIGASGANRPRDVYAAGTIYAGVNLGLSSNNGLLAFGSSFDTILARDAANTLAQRNGTNAQTFRLYGTYTDISNSIYLGMRWSGVDMRIQTSNVGSGTSTPSTLTFGTNGTEAWRITTANHLTAVTDNTYDIGASGANRPRAIYTAGLADIRGSLYVGGAVEFIGVSAGVVTLREFATSAFNRLQFGGTSSAFPSLKRSGAEMHVRLADDSNYANLACLDLLSIANVRAQVNTAIPAGGTTGAGLRVSSTANFGVFFGSGAPTLSAAKGSLYLRSDGTTTNDRMYVNTDGASTWTAVTTAA